jgi:trigger factor
VEVTISRQQGLDATLSVKVQGADYAQDFEKSLEDYRKKIALPGFRKGKVPLGVVRKMVGKDVKRELVEKFLQRSIQDYIQKENLKLVLSPLSTYIAEDIDWQQDNFEFSYDIGLRPEIKLDLKKLNRLTKYKIEATDAEIDEEIEKLRRQYGKVEHIDTYSSSDDQLNTTIHFHELDEEGKELEGGVHKVKVFQQSELPKKLKTVLEGQSKGYKTSVKIADILSTDEIADILGVDKSTIKDMNPDMEVEIRGLFRVEMPEMNQEFFDQILEPGKASTEEEFRAEWKQLVENYFNREAESVLVGEMKKALLEDTEMKFPEQFLDKYMLLSYEAKDKESIENYDSKRKAFEEELKWLMISEFISEQQDIQVTEEDVIEYTKDMIRGEFARSGVPNLEDDKLRQYALNYLTKESNFNRTSLALRDGKVFEYLLSQVQPKIEAIGSKKFEEFRNKA